MYHSMVFCYWEEHVDTTPYISYPLKVDRRVRQDFGSYGRKCQIVYQPSVEGMGLLSIYDRLLCDGCHEKMTGSQVYM